MDQKTAQAFIDEIWMDSIVPELVEYIKIPNKSPHFDADWFEHGYMEDAVQQIFNWSKAQDVKGMTLEIVRLEGRTPLIFMEIPAQGETDPDDTILMYGHLDKQPEMTGWADDLGPWIPVIKDDKLYGRGGADDGYAAYSSLAAIMAVQKQDLPHARIVVIIEACEESGSYDLPFYIEHLKDRIGEPSLVICLDSGYASGVVPSSFRIMQQLFSRLEDQATGKVLPDYLYAPIPEQRLQQTQAMAEALGDGIWQAYPFTDGVEPMAENNVERLLNRTWRPALSYTGIEGIPALADAGNVLRPYTAMKVSMRLPATLQARPLKRRWKPTHLRMLKSVSRLTRRHPAGTHPRLHRGCMPHWKGAHRAVMGVVSCIWARVARFHLWLCWVIIFQKRNL
jgi:acetylornithine deacetylase/succinyl-diaminopimelate desuccinylase-like protein